MSRDPAPAHTFILRVWLERQGPEPGEWRGELRHVPSGERVFFRGFHALPPLLAHLLTRRPGHEEPPAA
jgi:hypothetical protein